MNKKKIFGSIAVIAIAAISAFNINVSNKSENEFASISFGEIEALAQEAKLCSSAGGGSNNGICTREYYEANWKCESFSWHQSNNCIK